MMSMAQHRSSTHSASNFGQPELSISHTLMNRVELDSSGETLRIIAICSSCKNTFVQLVCTSYTLSLGYAKSLTPALASCIRLHSAHILAVKAHVSQSVAYLTANLFPLAQQLSMSFDSQTRFLDMNCHCYPWWESSVLVPGVSEEDPKVVVGRFVELLQILLQECQNLLAFLALLACSGSTDILNDRLRLRV
ncbi:hypothetical protein Tco_0702564 [Tanacetum coccineum]|uniref:Uncharacterized protein n=1 Tax=Tanacetum coccineum TaxID=301880 RepID=A0ABQ4XY83_9ASTR